MKNQRQIVIGHIKLPWPELKVPAYREGKHGTWELRHAMLRNEGPGIMRVDAIRGYFNGYHVAPARHWRLYREHEVWMSITPQELESMSPHVAAARGHVVIAGLGMGVVAYNCALKRSVHTVTVLESDPDVVRLFEAITDRKQRPKGGGRKLRVIHADARTWVPDAPVDFLYGDIWLQLGDSTAVPDMQRMQRNINATHVGWWGQEIDFTFHCAAHDIKPITQQHYRDYATLLDLPMIEQSNPNYYALAFRAAQHVVLLPTFLGPDNGVNRERKSRT